MSPPPAAYRCEVQQVRRVLTVVLACGFALPLPAQQGDIENPYTSPEDVAAGGRIFRSHCAACHGINGTGGRGPDLTTGEFHHGGSTAAIVQNIAEGIPGTEMPSAFFEGRQLWQLVAYVRSLSERPRNTSHSGDASRGQSLFDGKGGCRDCHQINGDGGRGGPDLSYIGASRSSSYLRESLLAPGERVLPKDYRVSAVTKNGRRISGKRLNEDIFSVQLLDGDGNLVSLSKADLSAYSIDKSSSMPSFAGALNDGEVADVIAYLSTLRRGGRRQ